MKLLTKEAVGLAFSKAAFTYDKACDFQRETALDLIQRILDAGGSADKILDIGMGTGRITQELASAFRRQVFGCDIAWGMVSFSKANYGKIIPTQADMESLPYKAGVFDMVFSNIAHQWGRDIRSAFLEVKRVLKTGGRLYFSILVNGSLDELYKSIEMVTGEDYSKGLFPDAKRVRSELINAGLELDWFETKTLKRHYKNSFELVKRLKAIGAGRISGENIFGMGRRGLFLRMLEAYDGCFSEGGAAFASYNVVLGCARKI